MPEHDVIALNASFENWIKDRAAGLMAIQPYLYYVLEHITKQYNLTDEEVQYGITDGANDGGVDAIYCLAGKTSVLLRDDINSNVSSADTIRIMVFQVKSSLTETGIGPCGIDDFAHFADDLLNLSSPILAGKYNSRLMTRMQTFKDKFLEFAHNFPRLLLEFYYVTRADGININVAEQAAIDRLKYVVTKHRGTNSHDKFKFEPVDTVTLLEYVRRRRQFPRLIRWSQQPLPVGDGYVGMVKLPDYYKFLKDEKGELDELIFESNVRGNQGKTSVNRQMRNALDKTMYPDFWQLNNGITITCSALNPVDAYSLEVHDAQVVNGLQTSRQIFGHFADSQEKNLDDSRVVLIKLLPVSDDKIRDAIIRATNNQNPMKAAALRATDERQRDIEDLFKTYDYFYDRRPGYWKDQKKEIVKIVSLIEIVQAMAALVLHRPDDARARPGNYIMEGTKGDEKYQQIFGTSRKYSRPLGIFLKTVQIIRTVKDFLSEQKDLSPGDRVNLMFYVAYHLICDITQTAWPTATNILAVETGLYSDKTRLENSLDVVKSIYQQLTSEREDENPDTVAKGVEFLAEVQDKLKAEHGAEKREEIVPRKKQRTKDVLRESVIK